jgi:hypothetical protein
MEHNLKAFTPEKELPQAVIAPVAAMLPANDHPSPSTEGKTAAEYTYEAMKMHQEQYSDQGKAPPAALKWIGDASLTAAPKNRMYSAIGLTLGLMGGGKLANIALGRTLTGKQVTEAPFFLKKLHKIVKDYDPNGLGERNKWLKYAHWATYSLGGMLGIKAGTDYAYKDVVAQNKNPRYLEDYLTSVAHTQGKTWSWLSAFSGIFGSASGTWAIPVPGINYAMGMVGRITSMQDRNTMVAGLNGMVSGASTTSYLRLKEGMHYLCHHAVGNPAKDLTQTEYLAYTLLAPVFKEKLTPEHIKQFTDTVNEVRDHYWQEGGIPKERKAEALNTMKEVFTGAGLEVLLINMGLNPAAVAFDKRNGLVGKIGNIGHADELKNKQEAYWSAIQERLPKYVAGDIMSRERADWVKEGIAQMRIGKYPGKPPAEAAQPAQEEPLHTSPPVANASRQPSPISLKPRENSIEKLLKSARREGDWRERTLQQRQEMDTPRFISE